MKRLIYIFIIAAASSMLFSCSLDETNYVEIQKETYINNASEAETVLLGVYSNMTEDGLYGYHLSLFFTLGTDEAKVEGNSLTNYRNVPNNAFTSTEDEVQATWQALYNAIYEANDFIERLSVKYEDFSESDRRLAAVYMAEARSLRALFYFELVRWFGNVPLMTSTVQSLQHPSTFVQAAPQDVYDFIEQDLLYAIDVLPYASDDVYRDANSFRFSKGGALGLLAKVYATWAGYPLYDDSKWEQAAKTAQVLINSGKHGLLEDYETLWYNSGKGAWDPMESLIEVSFYSPTITGNSTNDSSGRIGKWNGVSAAAEAVKCGRIAANWKVLPTFALDWYESGYPNDKRWSVSCADHKYTADASGKTALWTYKENNVTKQGYWALAADPAAKPDYRKNYNNNMCPGKWDIPKYVSEENNIIDANVSNVNWYLLRYADVLLLYAEALNEWKKGPSDEAFAAVNAVRRRGYGLPVSTSSSVADLDTSLGYEQFRQAVRKERAYELAFEGHRRQDLVRWGIYYETIQQTFEHLAKWHDQSQEYYKLAQYTIKGKHELLPIPQRDKDLCPLFRQNPGW